MLGFLRRKDKRARNAPPAPAPLRDRNAPVAPPRGRAAARANTSAKENAAANIAASDDPLPRSDTRRKLRPPVRSPTPGASPAKEKPRRARFNAKHEPAVNKNILTNDRRRSFKAPAAAYTDVPRPSMDKPSHRRRPSVDKVAQAAAWPHVELANALKRNDIDLANSSVRRLVIKAKDQSAKLKMIQEGVARSLMALLKHERANLEMRRLATTAISELAVLDSCEGELVSAGTVPVLVWLINPSNNTDRVTLGSACRALRNLLGGSDPTAVQAAKYGCVDPLLRLIDGRSGRPEEPEVVPEATAALANLAHHGYRFQSYVIKHQGLNSLNMLGSKTENEDALFHIVNVLAEFAVTEKWQLPIVATGGLNTAFRALTIAKDVEVAAEAARLIGNVAVTRKARTAVRDAGGISVLLERLSKVKSFKDVLPALDICNALANVCADSRAASDALFTYDGAGILLRVYTDEHAPERVVRKASRVLRGLADGSTTRRARVLYSVGSQIRQAAGRPLDRLYDLRQAILDMQEPDSQRRPAMPESLERLSRASVRLINTGVTQQGRSAPPSTKPEPVREPRQPLRANSPGHSQAQKQYPERSEFSKTKNDRSKFRSTGRVLSVARQTRPKPPASVKQLSERAQVEEDEYDYVIPHANEQALADDIELRAVELAREADGGFAKDFFEVGQVLGKGGYGSVFLAKDLRTNELVAIKQFHQSGSLVDKKALKEQRIWKGLHHQNVVEFKGSFVGDKGSLNLVVEYVNGLSLADHLSQYSAFPETLVAEIARQVLLGLEYLHANGVTHRDLKPANILVDHKAAVKICDFGVSRSENVQTINPGQQHMVGTPWYIAPEMIEYRPYTTSVDVWSLGCTVLELATGRRPYHELSAMQVLFRMVEDRCPPVASHLSPECKNFLHACWIWDPEARPSASTLLKHPFILKARKFSGDSKKSSTSTSS